MTFGSGGAVLRPDGGVIAGCEIFSSTGPSGTTFDGIESSGRTLIINNNIHDIKLAAGGSGGGGIVTDGNAGAIVVGNIVAKCTVGPGISVQVNGSKVFGNTIDGNGGDGIYVADQSFLPELVLMNNIVSNQTGVGKFGLNVVNGTATANAAIINLADYNTFYNNTSNYNNISAGVHDNYPSSSPYVAQSTENYTLA
jgi:hypothetical protein